MTMELKHEGHNSAASIDGRDVTNRRVLEYKISPHRAPFTEIDIDQMSEKSTPIMWPSVGRVADGSVDAVGSLEQ